MALNPGDTLFNGHYHVVRLLGRGGFGFVYQARDTLLNHTVAIKELIPALVGDESTLKRFLAEARATMGLSHRHIVRTHSVFQEGENYYIVMEYMAGGSLEQRLRESGALDMAGNVWEWVADWYGGDYYDSSPLKDPQGPGSGTYRVLRGGSWLYGTPDIRTAFRNYDPPGTRRHNIGFRCAASAEE